VLDRLDPVDHLGDRAHEEEAAHLAVGDHVHARALLEGDHLVDRAVLDPLERGGAELTDPATMMAILPKWDGTDAWPVVLELLNNGDIENPKVQFKDSYVVTDKATGARTWVSGSFGDITLNLAIQGFTLALTVSNAVITMDLNDDNSQATNGTIAGVLNTEQLLSELAKVAGSFDPSLCPPSSTFESIAQQIRQASDIGSDGTQDPTKECDGISIGLGFNMQKVVLGPVAPPAMPGTDPCMAPM
jgi:hypothetical protein